MREWDEIQAYIKEHSEEDREWYKGFLEALLYAQATFDVPGGQQTLKVRLPEERWANEDFEPFDPIMLACTCADADDGGIVWLDFTWEKKATDFSVYCTGFVEIGSTEGHFGDPDRDCNFITGAEELWKEMEEARKLNKELQERRMNENARTDQ